MIGLQPGAASGGGGGRLDPLLELELEDELLLRVRARVGGEGAEGLAVGATGEEQRGTGGEGEEEAGHHGRGG